MGDLTDTSDEYETIEAHCERLGDYILLSD